MFIRKKTSYICNGRDGSSPSLLRPSCVPFFPPKMKASCLFVSPPSHNPSPPFFAPHSRSLQDSVRGFFTHGGWLACLLPFTWRQINRLPHSYRTAGRKSTRLSFNNATHPPHTHTTPTMRSPDCVWAKPACTVPERNLRFQGSRRGLLGINIHRA